MKSVQKMQFFVSFVLLVATLVIAGFTFQNNAWKPILTPEQGFDAGVWGSVAIWAFIFLLFGLGVMSFAHSKVSEKYTAFSAAQSSFEARRAQQLVGDLKYHEFSPIVARTADGGETKMRVFAKPVVQGERNISQREVILLDEQGESGFTYSVLMESYSWQRMSADHFAGETDAGLPMERAIRNDYLRAGVAKAPYVVCFGLASSEADNVSAEDNERLSDARGINLCKALINIGYVIRGPQVAIGVGAGYSTQPAAEVADINRQRATIIVAVRYTHKKLNIEEFVLAMNELIAVPGVDLSRYSRKPSSFTTANDVSGGHYLSAQDIKHRNRENGHLLPVIPRAVE